MIQALLIFIISLAVLIFASDRFISAAEKIGLSWGISPFIIGVTIVAFGTSLPELATSIASVYKGQSEIVVGNVIGSNITNILLVIGLTTLAVRGLTLKRFLMDVDIPLLFGSAILLWFALSDGRFSLLEAFIFLSGLVGFLYYSIKDQDEESPEKVSTGIMTYVILLAAGVAVYFGATYTVDSIVELSGYFGVDPSIVSLGALALGTSLPEIVVSISAARKGQHEMAIGNVMGSNIFNTYGVMAIPSFFGELTIPDGILAFSLPFMMAVTGIFGLITYSKRISFWEAGMLLSFYIFFLAELLRLGGVN